MTQADSADFASADLPAPPTTEFIVEKWNEARILLKQKPSESVALVFDEVQKIPRWSEVIKGLADEDRRNRSQFKVALLGSSALLIEKGLSESLTGRFEANYFPHWVYGEIEELSGASLAQYMRWGGYPKVYEFMDDHERAAGYIENSILEPSLGRDILALHSVEKPALLRHLFWYVSRLPAQIVSYEKILGHLRDRGNSATLEAFVGTIKRDYLYTSDCYDAETVLEMLPSWFEDYNSEAPHSALQMMSPKEFIGKNNCIN